jgi:putative SOS response-associated peptidase YedK
MCGRYAFNPDTNFYSRYPTKNKLPPLESFDSCRPGDFLPVIYQDHDLIIDVMRWGLIPQWAKNLDFGATLFNARSETLSQKPSFSGSFVSCRCLVPCSGFYEARQFFNLKDQSVFSLAGLYSLWESPSGDYLPTFTIITTEANDIIKPVHDRMPVILSSKNESIWLDPQSTTSQLQPLFRPFSSDSFILS